MTESYKIYPDHHLEKVRPSEEEWEDAEFDDEEEEIKHEINPSRRDNR